MAVIKASDSRRYRMAFNSVTFDANWSCRFQVRRKADYSLTSINRLVTDKSADSKQFVTFLTSADTSALGEGDYYACMRVYNDSTGESKQGFSELKIERSLVG